jgi:hypothetical protein
MKCPEQQSWHLLSARLLSEQESAELHAHAADCAACQARCAAARQDHGRLLRAFEVFDQSHDQLREQLMSSLPQAVSGEEFARDASPGRRRLGDVPMYLIQKTNRWAVAALLPAAVIVVVVGLFLFGGSPVALAHVLERIRGARTLTCNIEMTTKIAGADVPGMKPEETVRATLKMYAEGDERMWLQEYEQNGTPVRMLQRDQRAYLRIGDELRMINLSEPIGFGGSWGPNDWMNRLLRVSQDADRRLPAEMINGREAIGFEIAGWKLGHGTRPGEDRATPDDSTVLVQVWVDSESGLPVRIDTEQRAVLPAMKIHSISRWENIQWNAPLDVAEFEPPAEAPKPARTHDLAAVDEAGFIAGMRAWIEAGKQASEAFAKIEARAREKGEPVPPELANVRNMAALEQGYPARLDSIWLNSAFMTRAQFAAIGDRIDNVERPPADQAEADKQEAARQRARELAQAGGEVAAQAALRIMPVAMFYQRLANDGRNPEYAGASVQPGDAASVLLRWRLDDDHDRVIYGDLHGETAAREK